MFHRPVRQKLAKLLLIVPSSTFEWTEYLRIRMLGGRRRFGATTRDYPNPKTEAKFKGAVKKEPSRGLRTCECWSTAALNWQIDGHHPATV
jgi:hypothetical protein